MPLLPGWHRSQALPAPPQELPQPAASFQHVPYQLSSYQFIQSHQHVKMQDSGGKGYLLRCFFLGASVSWSHWGFFTCFWATLQTSAFSQVFSACHTQLTNFFQVPFIAKAADRRDDYPVFNQIIYAKTSCSRFRDLTSTQFLEFWYAIPLLTTDKPGCVPFSLSN